MTRSCLLCGEMICGCKVHTYDDGLRAVYGLCDECTKGIARRCGESRGVRGEMSYTERYPDQEQAYRVLAELERLKRA